MTTKETMKETMQEKIFAAADALDEQGQKPTLRLIRKEIGGGSYSTIQDALKKWHAGTAKTAAPIREPIPQNVSAKLEEFGNNVWSAAVEMANARITSEREALETVRAETEALREEATQLADQLTAELEAAAARITAMEAEATETGNKLAETQNTLAMTQARAETGEARADELRTELNRAHADRDKALSEAAELRGRLKTIEEITEQLRNKEKSEKTE